MLGTVARRSHGSVRATIARGTLRREAAALQTMWNMQWRASSNAAGDDMSMVFGWQSLHDMQTTACAEHSDKPLFGTKLAPGKFNWTTYGEFAEMVDNCRAAIAAQGVKRGDKIAIISKNRVEWAVVTFASYGLGVHSVPMYEAQLPSDWEYIVKDSGAKMLLVSTEAVRDKAKSLVGVGQLKDLVCFDAPSSDPDSFAARLQLGAANPVPALDDLPPEELATLIYTSGTTGKPKGVMLTHHNVASNVQSMRRLIGHRMNSDSVSLSFLPWAHVYGQTAELLSLMSAGGALGLAESPMTLLEDIQVVKPSILVAVPTVYNKIYDAVKRKLSAASPLKAKLFTAAMAVAKERRCYFDENKTSLDPMLWLKWHLAQRLVFRNITQLLGGRVHMAITGGAALSFGVQEFFGDIGIPIIEGYGLTETSPCVASERFGPTERTQGGLRAIAGVTIHICTVNGEEELGVGEEGEICVSGPNVMEGYHGQPDKTAEVLFNLRGEKTFRTGDLGRLSPEGVLSITGRVKEQYKLENGKFVVPGPIEDGIRLASMHITQAFVYGHNREYNVILIRPDFESVAAELRLSGDAAKPQNMVTNEAVRGLIAKDIDRATASMKHYTIPKKFQLITDDFTVENGLLTPKMSMKRPQITAKFAEVLDAMYSS